MLKYFLLELPVEFFLARDVGLDRRDPQRLGRRLHLQGANAKGREADDRGHRQGEIEMRPPHLHFRLEQKAPDGRDRDDVGKRDHKRKTRHAGELRDLNDGQKIVQRDPKTVPAPAAEHPAAHPFQRGPGGGEDEREPEIMKRAEPGRARFRRQFVRRRDL